MYYCQAHNWSSLDTQCPYCFPVAIVAASTETQPEQNRGQEESVNVPPYQTELDMTGIINGEKSIAELDEILREFYTENKQEYGESFGRAVIHDIIRIVSKSQRMLYEDEAIRFFNWVQLNVDEKFNYTTPQLYQLFKKPKK